eukprot:scaffold2882_cov434-Prasinococcus_capsulatus_cf.AAC.12
MGTVKCITEAVTEFVIPTPSKKSTWFAYTPKKPCTNTRGSSQGAGQYATVEPRDGNGAVAAEAATSLFFVLSQ